MKIAFAFTLIALFLLAFAGKPTEEQIRQCVDTTGWTEERCEFELTK